MRTTLVIYLFLATHLHAEIITRSSSVTSIPSSMTAAVVDSTRLFANATTPSTPLFDVDEELAKIAAACLTTRDHEDITGGMLRNVLARFMNVNLVNEAQEVIGLEELRSVLGFAPPGPWTEYRKPSEDEIAAAPTIEAYYELKEPRTEIRSLDSIYLLEKNFPPAIAFLDKRFPAIRTIYRSKFEEIRRRPDAPVTVDRKEVDRMIDAYTAIVNRVYAAISKTVRGRLACGRASRTYRDLHK